MNITLVMVQSVNGNILVAPSQEDQEHFQKLKRSYSCLIMGRKTYEIVKNKIQLSPELYRIVLTKNASEYKNIPQCLEFSNETPIQLIDRLASLGYTSVLLAGGSEINKSFFENNLITDCYITIEPQILRQGKNLTAEMNKNIHLHLLDLKKINRQGTLVLHYKIIY